MLEWEIFGENLMWTEVYLGAGLLGVVLLWTLFRKVPAAFVALLITCAILVLSAFRPFNYNSDTRNYFSYVYHLSFVNTREIFFLTKLEPVHSALILLLKDFKLWLIFENSIQILGLILCYKARRNDFSFIVICAFSLTFATSSLRFCSALILYFYLISRSEVNLIRAARMTIFLSLFHISMLVSGALALRRREILIGISVICAGIFFESSVLGSRIDLNVTDYFSDASKGFRNLAVALSVIAYLFVRSSRQNWLYLFLYALASFSIFMVSSQILLTFNRFLIMLTLVLVVSEWSRIRGSGSGDIFDRAFTFFLSSLIIVPYAIGLPRIYFNGTW